MNRKTILLMSSLIALMINTALADRLFILYDPNCMDKLEYSGPTGGNTTYSVTLSTGEKMILDIGVESDKDYSNQLPTPLYGCDNGLFNQQLVQRINTRKDEVFVVYRKNNRVFTVSPVQSASYVLFNDQVIDYQSPAYQFRFDRVTGVIGENINTNKSSSAEITFEGIMNHDCMEEYIFRQIAPRSNTPYTDLTVIPQIGIVEERKGLTFDQAANNALRLTNVNGKKLDNYIASLCKTDSDGSQPITLGPKEYEVNPVYTEPSNVTAKTPVQPTAAQGQVAEHTIAKGETLYAISRKYNVSVKDLQSWNNMGSSTTIRAGSTLKVAPAAATTTAKAATSATTNQITSKSGLTFIPATTNTAEKAAVTYPIPYESTDQRIATSSTSTQQAYYTAQAGDTPASLALKFGYTEARFREMNGLTANQVLKVGQKLKTTDCDCPPSILGTSTTSTSSTVTAKGATEYDSQSAPIRVYSQPQTASPSSYDNTDSTPLYMRPTNTGETPVPAATGTYPAPTANYNLNYSTTPASPAYPTGYDQPTSSPQGVSVMGPVSYDNTSASRLQVKSPVYQPAANGYAEEFEPAGKRTQYIVQDGETLFSIARKNAITVERLRMLNGLDANEILIPGQRIYLN